MAFADGENVLVDVFFLGLELVDFFKAKILAPESVQLLFVEAPHSNLLQAENFEWLKI